MKKSCVLYFCPVWYAIKLGCKRANFASRDGDTYHGHWAYQELCHYWVGNPVKSAEVEDIMKSIKYKSGCKGSEQRHSAVMSVPSLTKLFVWSVMQCPGEFTKFGTHEELVHCAHHL